MKPVAPGSQREALSSSAVEGASDRPLRLLVVEDEAAHQEIVRERLQAGGVVYEVEFAGTRRDAARRLFTECYDCVVLDHRLPDGAGHELLTEARSSLLTTPVVALSTSVDPDVALAEFKAGCVNFIPKRDAFKGDTLAQVVGDAIRTQRARAAVERSGFSEALIQRAGRLLDFSELTPARTDLPIEDRVQRLYETAIRTIRDGVILIERRQHIVFANPGFKRLLGFGDAENLPGHPLTTIEDVFMPESAVALRDETRPREQIEARVRCADGASAWVLVSETALGPHGALWAVSDLRCVKEQQRQLESQNRRLADLNEMANRFVDNVSHEFRTPLTVIKGYVEVVSRELAGPVTEEQRGYLTTVLDRTRDLAQMVDDLLDTSKLRAGRLRVDRRRDSIAAVLGSVRSAIEQKAQANQILIEECVPGDLPDIYADGEKVGRVILNLVVNAIKFADANSVVRIWARAAADDRVEVGVTDEGPGISPENLERIFERFGQVGDPRRSSTKGFGLGLSIASELIAMNLGRMHVTSELGVGSTFSFDLPRVAPRIAGARLLAQTRVRDDDHAMRIALLEAVAPDGEGRVEQLRSFIASNVRPMDLILEAAEGRLAIFGVSAHPDRWAQRLAARCAQEAEEYAEPAPRVTLVESWPFEKSHWPAALDALALITGEESL